MLGGWLESHFRKHLPAPHPHPTLTFQQTSGVSLCAGGKAGLAVQRPEAAEQREKNEAEQPGGDQAGSKLEGEGAIALRKEPQNELGWDGCSWIPPASTTSVAWFLC